MGTLYTALELGVFAGALLLGLYAGRFGYRAMWWVAALVAWLAAVGASPDLRRPRG
jgi:predicted MFS family arabinose efflux permease